MQSSLFVFGTDLLHEGIETVLDNVQRRAGAGALALSATYHHARDVFAHNPRVHVYRHEGDVAWFVPHRARYGSGLVPRLASEAGGADLLRTVCDSARRRDLAVDAWTIFLHNSALATEHPDCATRNVCGDPYLTDLCPANPRVRAYARELAADLGRYPVRRLLAESLHYRPLEHGEHHERYLLPLPPQARSLLALCFCGHCRSAASAAGIDVSALTAAVRTALEPVWQGDAAEGVDLLPRTAADELDAYVQVRMATVTSLVAEVHEVLRPTGVTLTFIDHAGTMPHVMLGTRPDDDVLASSRKLGVDVAAVARVCDEVAALGYADTPARVEAVLAAYRRVLGSDAPLSLALRPLNPDCRDAANLAAKVAAGRAAQVRGIDFYHYAMMPLKRLDWIAAALEGRA